MPRKSMHYIMVNVNKGFSTWTACPLHTNKTIITITYSKVQAAKKKKMIKSKNKN